MHASRSVVRARLPARAELVAAGVNLVHDATAAEVVGALSDAGVRSIVLKGPAVIRWLYPEITDRFSVDVDMLVSPEDVDQAGRALATSASNRTSHSATTGTHGP